MHVDKHSFSINRQTNLIQLNDICVDIGNSRNLLKCHSSGENNEKIVRSSEMEANSSTRGETEKGNSLVKMLLRFRRHKQRNTVSSVHPGVSFSGNYTAKEAIRGDK